MRFPDPSIPTAARSAVVPAPVRASNDRGPAFEDAFQSAVDPSSPTTPQTRRDTEQAADEMSSRPDAAPFATPDALPTALTGQPGPTSAPAASPDGLSANTPEDPAVDQADGDSGAAKPGLTEVVPETSPVTDASAPPLPPAHPVAPEALAALVISESPARRSAPSAPTSAAVDAAASIASASASASAAGGASDPVPSTVTGRVPAATAAVDAAAAAPIVGEGVRVMGELSVRVTDTAPVPAPSASPSKTDTGLAATSGSSAPASAALPTPAASPSGTPAVQQTNPAAPVLPGRPTHIGHPPLSAQIGTELLSLRQTVNGDHIVTIAVRPDNLGPVTISAVVGRDGMNVELFSPSPEGRDALKQMLPDLRRDLASAGGSGSSLDLGARDAPQERPRHREFGGSGHVAEPRFRATLPAALHPSSARLDVLV